MQHRVSVLSADHMCRKSRHLQRYFKWSQTRPGSSQLFAWRSKRSQLSYALWRLPPGDDGPNGTRRFRVCRRSKQVHCWTTVTQRFSVTRPITLIPRSLSNCPPSREDAIALVQIKLRRGTWVGAPECSSAFHGRSRGCRPNRVLTECSKRQASEPLGCYGVSTVLNLKSRRRSKPVYIRPGGKERCCRRRRAGTENPNVASIGRFSRISSNRTDGKVASQTRPLPD
jgi:hypothetical protein